MSEQTSTFRALHQPGNPFILANAWDKGSARMLASMGAKAIATSSAAHAFTLGKPDMGHVSRSEAISHAQDLAAATPLPVSGDLENGYGDSPQDVAETILKAAEAGLAGACIEDTCLPSDRPYEFAKAVERIEAAVEIARNLKSDFVLTARADGVMLGTYDVKEAIRRLQAFEKAGADCLYAPAPGSLEAQAEICRAVSAPVNALAAGPFMQHSVQDFANIGVARISLGSALARATHRIILDAGKAMFGEGDFTAMSHSTSAGVIDPILAAFDK
ncbi:MAG: isocitrate lyase/phosphoenolpyruvate mutase family protein [Cohaesibacter sp.]|jgi:2-methylisocitrate lyase-like PEP mutase family enzyme|nr:isocitrate lyase/phosphoenolpyruvate mutase family protein [Cohaesibacter sp.]